MKWLKKITEYIKCHRDGIFWALLLSIVYLFAIGSTYAILGVSLSDGIIPFSFSISIYVVETLLFLISLSYCFFED